MVKNRENIATPSHVAIIMDGNGRWAKANGKERLEGHYEGVVSVRSAILSSLDWGVEVLTIYAFSTENWGRPKSEVDGLMELFCKTIALEIPSLKEQSVKVIFIGERESLSDAVRESLDFCENETKNCNRLTLCVALNYGSRVEICEAVKRLAKKCLCQGDDIDTISVDEITNELYTKDLPEPDLIIRTSGEQRLSNFLLWQSAYSEFYFTQQFWPDFREESFDAAIREYSKRKRRFGAL